MGGILEKPQLINFVAKVMEESGFKVYKNFKTSQTVIDIYAVLQTTMGDFGVVVACNNNSRDDEVSIDLLKEMEDVAENLKASKVTIVTSSYFTNQATNYALRKNIKLVDRENLLDMAKKYQMKDEAKEENDFQDRFDYVDEEYPGYDYDTDDMNYLTSERQENPMLYQNSLYKEIGGEKHTGLLSKFNRGSNNSHFNNSLYRNSGNSLYGNRPGYVSKQSPAYLEIIKRLLANPIILIIINVIVILILSYVLGNLLEMDAASTGLIQLLVALILSYGGTFYAERNRFFIIRGTVIFFISLIILLLLILF